MTPIEKLKADMRAAAAAAKAANPEPERKALFVKGGDWILGAPAEIPVVWGNGDEVLWASGEGLIIAGPPGVGKTTLALQVVWARLGLMNEVLGYSVVPGERVLYLAMDRPAQIRRAFKRLAKPGDRDVLNERLTLMPCPPPGDLAKNPELLTQLCREASADTVIIDSLKDAAIGLSDDEVAAGLNRSLQMTLAEGIEVTSLHHQRKSQNGSKPKSLEDLYGSTWISAGAGSVVLLWGQAGDSLVELIHLKQPAALVGPLKVEHDHDAGLSKVEKGFDLLVYLTHRGTKGATAKEAAHARLEKEPTENQARSERTRLDRLVKQGLARKVDATSGGPTGTQPARWFGL